MSSDVQKLMEVQEADRNILRLKQEIASLPKKVAAIEQKLAGTKAVLENAKTAVKADEAARRKYEVTIQELQAKISKYRDQSLDVKTNDQYKALLHEIQFSEQEIRGQEDKILELMLNAEAREKNVKAAEAELKAEMAEIEKEKADARERTAKDEKELAEWNAKRDQLRAGIDPDLLRHFERVSRFRGSGISEVLDQKCTACQVMLRPQTYNEVKSGKIIECESCQRILYFDPSKEVAAAPSNAPHHRRRVRPKSDAPQAWFYRPSYGEHGEVLLVYNNDSGTSSRRIYDFNNGREIGDVLIREGKYTLAFPEDMTDDTIRLNGNWDDKEVESWGSEMPMTVLDLLHVDLQAARSDASHRPAKHDPHEAITSEHPAAS
jgi:predicted  nucleic acid-binding Zn-ribbon protein